MLPCICATLCSSLKTADNVATIKGIPLERMMVESDAPWCEIRPTHAAFQHTSSRLVGPVQPKQKATSPDAPVKGRNEPFACRYASDVPGFSQATLALKCRLLT